MCLAIPTQITEIDDQQMATVMLGGVERRISLIMTPEAQLGDYVLVHTGYAISVLSPEEAQASLETFAELAEIQAELGIPTIDEIYR
ncbi:MAG: HypC/HybG/HupF family hydrogenase formation chaperone [Anaerolineae bacterium]